MTDAVINMTGTAKRKCICSTRPNTWLSHWERGTGLVLPAKCCAKFCKNLVEVGAHVKLIGYDARIPWIVPFCQYHNKRPSGTVIQLKEGVTLCGAAKVDCA